MEDKELQEALDGLPKDKADKLRALIEKMEADKRALQDAIPVERLIDAAIPKSLQARAIEQAKEHEEPYRLHPDMVAVFDVSTGMIPLIDGIPPYYDVTTGSPLDREIRGNESRAEFTKQGLRIYDRYEIVIHYIPTTDREYGYTVVSRKDWNTYQKVEKEAMTPAQALSALMLRSDGAI